MKNMTKYASMSLRMLLGILMLSAGLMKLFVSKPSGVSGMLTNIGFPIPMAFAWLLIAGEILSGLAIIANFRLKYSTIPPMVILLVALFTVTIPGALKNPQGWTSVWFHLIAIAGFFNLMAIASRPKSMGSA